jgi:eukaryotic-like serine/threonine-protein kinase
MAASIPEFWQLLTDSQLVTAEQCQQLMASFGQVKGTAMGGNARTLAEWLISRGVLTRYQTMVLMAGRSGPFLYGDYKLYDRLESGALAGMFRAVHVPTQHPVVLQFLTGPATQDPRQWAALAPQLQVHGAVQHPHLQRCFEVVDLTSYRFLVVEDLRGQSVDQQLLGGQRLAPAEACRIVRCAALALTPLHQRGVAHGDIRPGRLWLEQGGNVKLLREPVNGFVPVFLSQPDATGSLAPRADYLAPEFLQEGKSPDALTDIYALGCTLYELLAGQPPFPGADLRTKMHQHATQPIQPLDALGVPPGLTQVVAYLMAKNPAVRYQHLNQVIAQVSPFVDPSRLNVASPKPPTTQAVYERAVQQRPTSAGAAPLPVRPASGAAGPTVVRPAAVIPAKSGGPLTAPVAGPPAASASAGSVLHAYQRLQPAQQKWLRHGAIAGGIGLLLLIALIWANRGPGQPPAGPRDDQASERMPSTPDEESTHAVQEPQPVPPETGGRVATIADDGQQPWPSPTEGQPVSLRYLPAGAQCFLIIRPADLLSSAEGPKILQALGPAFARTQAAWEAAAGLPLSEIQQLVVSFHDHGDPLPHPTLVVRPKTPIAKETLLQKWGHPAPSSPDSADMYTGGSGWSYLLPEYGQGREFVVGRAEEIQEIRAARGVSPALTAAMEKLLRASDDRRHLTVLFVPNELISNLFRDGRPWSLCEPRQVREPLDWFLGDSMQAALFSVYVADSAYAELKFVPPLGGTPGGSPVAQVRNRLQQMPELVERYLAGLNPQPSRQFVALRYPQILRFLQAQSRFGAARDVTVINAALPSSVLHDLVFATQLALTSPSETGPAAATGDVPPPVFQPR